MAKFRTGDIVINSAVGTYYRVTGVFAEKYTMTQIEFNKTLNKFVAIKMVSPPIDLSDYVLEFIGPRPIIHYNQIWEQINV